MAPPTKTLLRRRKSDQGPPLLTERQRLAWRLSLIAAELRELLVARGGYGPEVAMRLEDLSKVASALAGASDDDA